MAKFLSRANRLALPIALPVVGIIQALSATPAFAETLRWQQVEVTPTLNDALSLTKAFFDNNKIFSSISLPYFTMNGKKYEIFDSHRISDVKKEANANSQKLWADYRIPVDGGNLFLTISYDFKDSDSRYQDIGEVSAKVTFSGPTSDYSFFWRMDPDLRGQAGDKIQTYKQLSSNRGYYSAEELEHSVELSGLSEFSRFLVRVTDGDNFANQTQLRIALPSTESATLYTVRSHDNEWESNPASLLNNEKIQITNKYDVNPKPVSGSDLVLWYVANIKSSSGSVGPSLYASDTTERHAVMEIDKMEDAEFPVASTDLHGSEMSLATAFATGGIFMDQVINDEEIPNEDKLTLAELDATLEARTTYQSTMDTPTQWYSWMGIIKAFNIPAVLGIMMDASTYSSDTAYREGAFAMYDSIVKVLPILEESGYPAQDLSQYLLWTVAHEEGHAYNQHHQDFWFTETSCFYEDTAIMGYSYDVANHLFWDFGPNSGYSMEYDPEELVRPGHGEDFFNDEGPYLYTSTRKHHLGHHRIEEFSGGGCE